MRTISDPERRARLMARHALAPAHRVSTPEDAAAAVVVLHATDPASVHLSALARMRSGAVADVERALYDDRTLIRMLGMRRTMFVVPRWLYPVVQEGFARSVAATQRRRYLKLYADAGFAQDVAPWLADIEESTLRALAARSEATGAELSTDEPRLRTSFDYAEGKAYGARVNITTHVLTLLSADGRIIRGRPRGSWLSSQYRWAPADVWLGDPALGDPTSGEPVPAWSLEAARVELARRWLATFGPGTIADLKWWTGLGLGELRKVLAEIAPVEVALDGGGTGLVLPDDVDAAPVLDPAAVLLPALDPTPMAWTERGWYLSVHKEALFDRNGNIGPTIWWDGRIVGGWGQGPTGDVRIRLLEDVGTDARAAIDAETERLTGHLGGIRVIPKFRTPLERELADV